MKKRRTPREAFLDKMDGLTPWHRLGERTKPFYPKLGCGRRPYPLGRMLRLHLLYYLSDPDMESLRYEMESVRRFVRLRESGAVPDDTTALASSRHRREKHGLGEKRLERVSLYLASHGNRLKTEVNGDTRIDTALWSTRNRRGERNPEMRQADKRNRW